MKSITIKGSERKREKLRLKPYVMLERFFALYGGDQPVHFSAEEKHLKDWCIPKRTHSCD
jgi:hypothetical protein